MAYGKRKRSSSVMSRKKSYVKRARAAATRGRTGYAGVLRASVRRATQGVKRLTGMIETKEGCFKTGANQAYSHNTVSVVNFSPSANIFARTSGTDDPMGVSALKIIGDACNIRGIKASFFIENSLARPKVYYRLMLLKGPRGAVFWDCFKGITGNMMIDQMNTEKYKVIASKTFNVTPSNSMANNVSAEIGHQGEPQEVWSAATINSGGTASKVVRFWIPGSKFGKGGNIQYENGTDNLKFFDYRWVLCVYDWYGSAAGNQVGRINEGYCKIYFKDA